MGNVAVQVDGIGKKYRLGARQERYRTLRDTVVAALKSPLRAAPRRANGKKHAGPDEGSIWALKDVSFDVKSGDVVGIIGRNGAGKSTLLKILSQITEPTEGCARIEGRIGSLLEVGTGFHPELTGRENVFLNGAILGMRRAEVERKFDEMVEFAEVAKFIDTPVKHYSSGMYLRLAFSVAAHLEPEILLVDEVLAVGDMAFQKKCLGKMGEVAQEGRTVLFVSHNMAAVRSLCTGAIVLKGGTISFAGDVGEAIYQYSQNITQAVPEKVGQQIEFTDVCIGNDNSGIKSGEAFDVSCKLHVRSSIEGYTLFCIIQDGDGGHIVVARTDNLEFQALKQPGVYDVKASFPPLWLRPGAYALHFKLMAETLSSGKARYTSDNIMLDVSANVAAEVLLGSLTPAVYWHVGDV